MSRRSRRAAFVARGTAYPASPDLTFCVLVHVALTERRRARACALPAGPWAETAMPPSSGTQGRGPRRRVGRADAQEESPALRDGRGGSASPPTRRRRLR